MLTASQILKEIDKHTLLIEPFDKRYLNPNSYNVHLSNKLKVYEKSRVLDTKGLSSNKPDKEIIIPEEGYTLHPGTLYIGSIIERVKSDSFISAIDGRSSMGRLGMEIHRTAGFGDVGFDGNYTLEISVVVPVIVYPNLEIAQVYFTRPDGDVDFLYNGRYQHQVDPTESRIEIDSDSIEGYHYKQ